jgi:hypothetical protein
MSEHDDRIKDTQALFKTLRAYFERFVERKTALLDTGILSDLSVRDHTVNEWLYDLEKRLEAIEKTLFDSTGAEHERPVEIPTHVDHLKK